MTKIDRLKLSRIENRHSKREAGIAKVNDECYAVIHSAFTMLCPQKVNGGQGTAKRACLKI